jgi:uncharacterized membrane protein
MDNTFTCRVCGKVRRLREGMVEDALHSPTAELLRRRIPDWAPADRLCFACAAGLRADYVQESLERDRGELSDLEAEVVRSLREHDLLSRNVDAAHDDSLTFGQRLADRVATFGGSWTFIIFFGAVLAVWIGVNTAGLLARPFDPFPYILLNLCLSCLAALQAPVIMMSQNRQEAKDRLRAENDFRVNLKAELEIRHLGAKLDQLISHQWNRLLEIQKLQMELMQEIAGRRPPS